MSDAGSTGGREAFVREKMAELAQRFVQRAAEDKRRMAVALQCQELDQLAAIAHQLAGAAKTFGHPEMGEQAKWVEDLVIAGAAEDELAMESQKLFDIIDQTDR